MLLAAAILTAGLCHSAQTPPKEPEVYDISAGKPVQIAAKKTKLPLVVYGESNGQSGTFIPSGYMGDASALKMISSDISAPLSSTDTSKVGETCLKIKYSGKGPAGWAGIFWMTPANNWGKIKGAGYDLRKAKKLTFWMKGEKGGERVSSIKFGGIVGAYPDTDSGSRDSIKLKSTWTRYEIDLAGKDMRHIVGGFVFTVTRGDNPRGATFYLDEIAYEGDPETSPSASLSPADSPLTASATDPVKVQP